MATVLPACRCGIQRVFNKNIKYDCALLPSNVVFLSPISHLSVSWLDSSYLISHLGISFNHASVNSSLTVTVKALTSWDSVVVVLLFCAQFSSSKFQPHGKDVVYLLLYLS